MIQLRTAGGWLDLAPGTISVEINNPYFDFDAVPGTTTYPFGVPVTGQNMRLLNFPQVRAAQGELPAPEPVEFYVDGVMWRVGSLVYREFDGAKEQLSYHFAADAADLAARIEGITLPGLDLGTVPLNFAHNEPDYALPVLRNNAFYGDTNPLFGQYVNYYASGGSYAQNGSMAHTYNTVPMPRLVPLLARMLGAVGWSVVGPWVADAEVQQLIVYSDRAADDVANPNGVATDVVLNRCVPDRGIGEVLVALQKMFALGYTFNSQSREVEIRALRDVVTQSGYLDRTPAGPARAVPATNTGYLLKMALPEDEQNKTLDTGWAELRVGGAKTTLETAAGSLHVVRDEDLWNPGREWLLPRLEGKGASPEFELGEDSRAGLALLFDRGLQLDSQGRDYPLATWGRTDHAGNAVGDYELRWAGPHGLYETWHRPWLDFLATATSEERLMQFRVADLLALDPGRQEMVAGRKYLWEKVSLSLSTTKRLETARFTYRYVKP